MDAGSFNTAKSGRKDELIRIIALILKLAGASGEDFVYLVQKPQ